MEGKLYVIPKCNLFDEFKQYILHYKTEPSVKTKEGKVVYLCLKNENDERVVLTCDNNHGKFNCDDDR